jgi:SPP1 gp7 family putative phage head morphogenesis protein
MPLDRIGRLLGTYHALPIPTNGNGAKTLAPVVEKKATAAHAIHSAYALSAQFIPLNNQGDTVDIGIGGFRAYAASVLAYAAMRYRAGKLSEAPLYVADETAEGEPWLQDHELSALLQYPNADEEMADLIEMTSLALDETGMAVWVIDRDGAKRPGRLTLHSGDEFTVRARAGRIYGEFELNNITGRSRVRSSEDVVFFRYPHPSDRWAGLAPAKVVARQLGIERKLLSSLMHGLDNAVVPGMTVAFREGAGPQTAEQMEEYRAMLGVAYQEARNHGKSFLAAGADVTQNRLGFQGLEGGGLYREIETAVCGAFGVRPEILGMMVGLENSPWSHMQTAQRLAYDETIIPLWRRYERAITRQLLRPMDDDTSRKVLFDTTKIRALQADAERDARRAVMLKGIATRNQRRQIAGLEPMEEDPDFWDAVEEQGSNAPNPPILDVPKMQAKSRRSDNAVRWMVADAAARTAEGYAEIWVREALSRMEGRIRGIVRGEGAKAAPDFGPLSQSELRRITREAEAYLTGQALEEWKALVLPVLQQMARQATERVIASVGISWDLIQPGVLKWVGKEMDFLAQSVTETTLDKVKLSLAEALEQGEGIEWLSARLEETGAFSPERAQLIARTETTRVTNGAAREGLSEYSEQTGRRIVKTWLSAQDARVRDEHAEIDGEQRPVDEAFSNGRQAPDEPNCRCTLIYAAVEAIP